MHPQRKPKLLRPANHWLPYPFIRFSHPHSRPLQGVASNTQALAWQSQEPFRLLALCSSGRCSWRRRRPCLPPDGSVHTCTPWRRLGCASGSGSGCKPWRCTPLDVHLDCIGHGRGVGDQPRSEGIVLPAQHLANGLGTDSPVRTLDHLAHLEGRDDDVTEAGG